LAKAEEALQEANTGDDVLVSKTVENNPLSCRHTTTELIGDKSQDFTAIARVSLSNMGL